MMGTDYAIIPGVSTMACMHKFIDTSIPRYIYISMHSHRHI